MSELREGLRVSNYLLEERIGGGSFGEVWRAKHHVFEESALKALEARFSTG